MESRICSRGAFHGPRRTLHRSDDGAPPPQPPLPLPTTPPPLAAECLEELGRREAHARVAVCEPEQCEEEDGDEAAAVGALQAAILRQRHGDVRERDEGGGGAGDGGGVGARRSAA